jgi:hypothetical protein
MEAQPPQAEAPKEVKSSGRENTSSSQTVANSTETKVEAKVEVPKGKELVPGFGLVMSLDILNKPMQMQQQQLEIALEYTQELPNELRGNQGFIINLITESNTADAFNNLASDRWNSLRRNNNLQSCYICD